MHSSKHLIVDKITKPSSSTEVRALPFNQADLARAHGQEPASHVSPTAIVPLEPAGLSEADCDRARWRVGFAAGSLISLALALAPVALTAWLAALGLILAPVAALMSVVGVTAGGITYAVLTGIPGHAAASNRAADKVCRGIATVGSSVVTSALFLTDKHAELAANMFLSTPRRLRPRGGHGAHRQPAPRSASSSRPLQGPARSGPQQDHASGCGRDHDAG